MATIDIKLKSYDELIFEITKLNTDKYLLEQENKELKENYQLELEENSKLSELWCKNNKILTELEEWINSYIPLLDAGDIVEESSQDTLKEVLDKIQELKEKYK